MTSIFNLHRPRITHKFCVAPNEGQEPCQVNPLLKTDIMLRHQHLDKFYLCHHNIGTRSLEYNDTPRMRINNTNVSNFGKKIENKLVT